MLSCDIAVVNLTLPFRTDERGIDKRFRLDGRSEMTSDNRSGEPPHRVPNENWSIQVQVLNEPNDRRPNRCIGIRLEESWIRHGLEHRAG